MKNINWKVVAVFGIAVGALALVCVFAGEYFAALAAVVAGLFGLLMNPRNGNGISTGSSILILILGASVLWSTTSCTGGQDGASTTASDDPSAIERLLDPVHIEGTMLAYQPAEQQLTAAIALTVYDKPFVITGRWSFLAGIVEVCIQGPLVPGGRFCRTWQSAGPAQSPFSLPAPATGVSRE